MTREVQQVLKESNIAFRSGDKALCSMARTNLKRGIRKVKRDSKSTLTVTTAGRFCLDSSTSPTLWAVNPRRQLDSTVFLEELASSSWWGLLA